ncbi:MAG: hypothetical protein Q8J64_03875 [Thermodesulfovibrionales bacterium]|nr:hypothetical protein [Thermodesulfovibrionales bacterium]
MLIKNKKIFSLGMVFAITFLGVLVLIFSPVFKGQNGLDFADNSFNKLSKGSSYFIPKVTKAVKEFAGKSVSVTLKYDKPEEAEAAAKLFTTAGAQAEVSGAELKVQGDLGAILQSAVNDSDAMYKNDGKTVADRYGMDEKAAMKSWWTALSKMEKNMKKEKLIAEGKVIYEVNKKAVEPGYNYYKIDAQNVSEHSGMMTGLLVFYVAYTMWWGYAIFYLFEGVGLTMKKSKVKKEI